MAGSGTLVSGALSKHGPPYLRWALIEAAHNAIRCYPSYRALAERQRARLGKRRAGSPRCPCGFAVH
jgi:transposase